MNNWDLVLLYGPTESVSDGVAVFLFYERKLEGLTICKCETEEELFPQLLKILKVGPTNHLDGKVDTPLRNCGSR